MTISKVPNEGALAGPGPARQAPAAEPGGPTPPVGRTPRTRRHLAVAAAGIGSSALAVVLFGAGGHDDDYITFWVAEQLSRSGRIVNLNGAHVEQSSSLAHVALLAGLHSITGAPLPALAYVLGVACLALTVWLAARLAEAVAPGIGVGAAVAVALAFPLVYWATSGMETTVAAASTCWFVLASLRVLGTEGPLRARTVAAFAVSTVLVVTVRPDTMVVAVLVSGTALVVVLARRARPGALRRLPAVAAGRAAVVAGGVVVAAGLVTVLHELLSHGPLPQPERSKSGGLAAVQGGVGYLVGAFPVWAWPLFGALACAGLVFCIRRRSLAGLLACAVASAGLLVLSLTRGDWMGGARLVVPYLAPSLVVVVAGACSLVRPWRRVAFAALLLVEASSLVLFSFTDRTANGQPLLSPWEARSAAGTPVRAAAGTPWYVTWNELHLRDSLFLAGATPVVREMLGRLPGDERLTVGSGQMGMVAYTWANRFPGRLTFVDRFSLATDDFARCPGRIAEAEGLETTYADWFAHAGGCAPPLPDVIFDIGSPARYRGLLARYRVVYRQDLSLSRTSAFGTITHDGSEFLAVRDGWNP